MLESDKSYGKRHTNGGERRTVKSEWSGWTLLPLYVHLCLKDALAIHGKHL